MLYGSGSVGTLETMAGTIVEQMLAQQAGIPLRSGSHAPCGESEDAKKAAGCEVRGVEITFEYGLQG